MPERIPNCKLRVSVKSQFAIRKSDMSRAHWLALTSLPGLGGVTVRKLLERFGDVESIFVASADELAAIPRVTWAMAEQLLASPIELLEEELLSLSDEGIDLLTWDDERFPANLRALPDAPVVLFMRGSLQPGDACAVAIVGTRAASEAAMTITSQLGCELAARALTIVSGFAQGIDTAAHQAALSCEQGRTLAVLGSGIRVIHPQTNLQLAEQIIRHGALLSELRPNTPPRGPQLMARDRVVSGLSRAVIVVEAGKKSGSLDTAARARKQGRLVYAVPGSAGTEELLRAGAERLDIAALDWDALAATIREHAVPLPDGPSQQRTLW